MSEQEKAREKQVPEEENTRAGQETPQETAISLKKMGRITAAIIVANAELAQS